MGCPALSKASRISINNGIVEVNGSIYSVEGAFLYGTVSGTLEVSKRRGLTGRLSLDQAEVAMERPRILVIGRPRIGTAKGRIEIYECRRGLAVNTTSKRFEPYEVVISMDRTPVSISLMFSPKRILIYYETTLAEIKETPLTLIISLGAMTRVAGPG